MTDSIDVVRAALQFRAGLPETCATDSYLMLQAAARLAHPAPLEADGLVDRLNEWLRKEWQSIAHARVELVREAAAAITQLRERVAELERGAGVDFANGWKLAKDWAAERLRAEALEAKVLALRLALKAARKTIDRESGGTAMVLSTIDAALSPDKGVGEP